MLYQKNAEKTLSEELFAHPTSEYRGTPFWSWNCALNKEILKRDIDVLQQMGFGGFHMHSRTGMATRYLGKEFMELVKFCTEEAKARNMLAWLYDEDRWPSGAAGGLITQTPKYRERALRFTKNPRDAIEKEKAIEEGKTYLIACYDVSLNPDGTLRQYCRIDETEQADGDKWYAYCTAADPSPWYNNQTYVDTLQTEAMDKFIEVTYEAYQDAVGEDFGNAVPAIFTDEPQFEHKRTLSFAQSNQDVILPWTPALPELYEKRYGQDVLSTLPELFWELADGRVSRPRYLYHDFIAEQFASCFADKCGGWCKDHGIALTGHIMEEPSLQSQTAAVGDAMRSYRSFGIPGIDMLCSRVELTTAKQAQSASRQYGKEGVLSELYGVTNWDYGFRGYKLQGDWQAALGVTVRVPHLSWLSMEGNAKRDYPASISRQSPWYKEFSYVEDHFARVNTAMTRGKAVVAVAVVHPVESYWLHWGPSENTSDIRDQLEENFYGLTHHLLLGLIDFDYLSESLLPDQYASGEQKGKTLGVGCMNYSTVIVPGCETLRSTTLEILKKFRETGGNLIFLGDCPKYIDAMPSDAARPLYENSTRLSFSKAEILAALKRDRLIEVRSSNGRAANNLVYQLRQDNDCRWLFLSHCSTEHLIDVAHPEHYKITLTGQYRPVLYDTIHGTTEEIPFRFENGNTVIDRTMYCHDSLLIKLLPAASAEQPCVAAPHCAAKPTKVIDFKTLVPYTLDEPNVLLLDRAEFSLDDGPFEPEEEILRLDNICRTRIGLPTRQGSVAQPWVIPAKAPEHTLALRFSIPSDIVITNPVLALEDAEHAEIVCNGKKVDIAINGFFTDESIKTLPLPPFKQGENTLTIKLPLGERTNTEWCYLLGDFNVRVEGCKKTIVMPTREIGFGPIQNQGLAFYGGNIVYRTEIDVDADSDLVVRANDYRGALIQVLIDGKKAGNIVYAPYRLAVKNVAKGHHVLEFKLFGTRYNSFGSIHNLSEDNWCGPDHWLSRDDAWGYEYRLRDAGILASPVIEVYPKER